MKFEMDEVDELYKRMFDGTAPTDIVLAAIGLSIDNIPRFRNLTLSKNTGHVVIRTRTGGGNRDFYQSEELYRENYPEDFEEGNTAYTGPWNDDLMQNPNYVSNEDDNFDNTYAYFFFQFPAEYASDLKAIAEEQHDYQPSQNWRQLVEKVKGESK